MPFPLDIPKQMPCPHWNHFPVVTIIGSISGSTPPSPDHFPSCKICKAAAIKQRHPTTFQ
ncbi:uncharacterized protein LOC142228386 [Haematobia irritans]|uniref:uncharacterized protein LOC142228386 n=1 Tax=Haematobia irritans TaxID=7368 RepID=UPI003F5079D7